VHRLGDEKPRIDYPCAWSYRLIGRTAASIEAVLERVVGHSDYRVDRSNTSATGKYVALRLTVVVQHEEQRLEIGRRLKAEDAILYVL
jgi:putative lipoic acid-binding regulatory protein